MVLAILLCASLSAPVCDTALPILTLKQLKESGAIARIDDLSILLTMGPEFSMAINYDDATKKRTIGFKWSVDKELFSHYDEIEKGALAFSDMVNLYFLKEQELNQVDEIMIAVNQPADSTKYLFFNLLVDTKLKYRHNTVDKRMRTLEALSICKIDHMIFPDLDNPSKNRLRLTIVVPDDVLTIEKELLPLKEAFQKAVEKFILQGHRDEYFKYELLFVDRSGGKKEYIFPVAEPKNETL